MSRNGKGQETQPRRQKRLGGPLPLFLFVALKNTITNNAENGPEIFFDVQAIEFG